MIKMYRKMLSFNNASIVMPDGLDCRIDETRMGFGVVALHYVTNPEECYETYKVFSEWYGKSDKPETDDLVQVLRGRIAKMTDDERLELILLLMDGYCEHCGTPTINGTCYCTNDE